MFLRVLIALMTVLLLSAHVDGAVETIAEAEIASSIFDDDPATYVVAYVPTPSDPTARMHPRDEVVPASEVLARVFRPPRASFD